MNQETLTVLILAGGYATRLWPLTEKRAKSLLPLAGKPLLQHILDKIPNYFKVIISTNREFSEDFKTLIQKNTDKTLHLFIEESSHDQNKKGALAALSEVITHFFVTSPLLVLAGDNYFGFEITDFLKVYQGKTLLAGFDTKSFKLAKKFGVITVQGTKLVSFVEKPENPTSTLVSTGCYLFAPSHLPLLQEYSKHSKDNLGSIFEFLLKKKEAVHVFSFSEPWLDIGSFESYLEAHLLLTKKNHTADYGIVKNCQFRGAVDIGKDCFVENSWLEDCLIMEQCTIKNARLRRCIIDKSCTIENVDLDHKMIREGAIVKGS